MGVRIEIISAADRLDDLAPEWWALWNRATPATPFQSPAWLIPWWRIFRPGQLFAIAARQGGELVGLAPFYVSEGRGRLIGVSLSDYLDVLIDPAHFDSVAKAIQGVLLGEIAMCATRWEMDHLAPHSQALVFASAGVLSETEPCPVLEFSPEAGGLAGAVPARERRKFRQAVHRAERSGDVEIVPISGADLQAAFFALIELHALRWRDRGGGVLADERVRRFHSIALPSLDRAGLLDFSLCRKGASTIAAYYGMRDHARSYAYIGGFDPDQAYISPGVLLIGEAIEKALRRGVREFHFLRGGERYKYAWGASDRMNRRIIIQNEVGA